MSQGCLDGITSPLTDGLSEAGIQNYNWFVAGVREDVLKMGISGRSWLLAANLLMRIVEENDMATARNLINNFVVTGNVEDGAISHVTIGRKPELANIKEFRNLKWVIPMKNANEMTTVPVRRIEKPATLDEAYKLIETMQSKATRSFFRFLKNGDLAGMKEQYDIGADIFAEDEETKSTPLMYADMELNKTREALGEVGRVVAWKHDSNKWNKRLGLVNALRSQTAVLNWLKAKCADCCATIYLLAKHGMKNALEEILRTYPVNATDGNGLTATDLALIDGDVDAMSLLVSLGGQCDRLAMRNQVLKDIIYCLPMQGGMTDDNWRLLGLAMDAGLSVDAKVHFCDIVEVENAKPYDRRDFQLPLIGLAIYDANERLLDLCIKHGARIDEAFAVDFIEDYIDENETPDMVADGKAFRVVKSEMMTPLEFAYFIRTFDDPIIDVLKRLGAKETAAATATLNKMKILKMLDDDTKRHEMYLDALKKLCTDKDDEQNHKLIIECLKRGESMEEKVDGTEFGPEVGEIAINASLWGMSVYFGWCDVVKECLKLGGNPGEDIRYHVVNLDTQSTTWWIKTAVDVVKGKDYADGRIKSLLLELLNKDK